MDKPSQCGGATTHFTSFSVYKRRLPRQRLWRILLSTSQEPAYVSQVLIATSHSQHGITLVFAPAPWRGRPMRYTPRHRQAGTHLPSFPTFLHKLTRFKGFPYTAQQPKPASYKPVSVLVSFVLPGDLLKYLNVDLPPPISIFGSTAPDINPTGVDQNARARPQTTAQNVNSARRRSYERISQQDEADHNIRYKKSRRGSTKKVKIVGPRDYPDASQSRNTSGSRTGPSQHPSAPLAIAVLCLPRTVSTHRSRLSRRAGLAH